MRLNTKRFLKGFSLIEVSISLLIVGIVSGICMTQLASFTAIDRMQKTQRHCDIIINALGAFYISSDGDLPPPNRNLQDGFGLVPFEKLGIMDKFAKDGYGNHLLYQVNPYFNKKTNNPKYINLGMTDFASTNDDKIAIILKSVDKNKNEIYKIWYSERNFKAMFKRPADVVENLPEENITEQNDEQQLLTAILLDDG